MKESEGDRLKCVVYESTRAPLAGSPFPNGEGLRYENTAISETQLFPRGEGKEEAVSPQKRKPLPPFSETNE